MTLISTNPQMEDHVYNLAKSKLGKDIVIIFEHGQWWVIREQQDDVDVDYEQEIYTVVDVNGGVDFELV